MKVDWIVEEERKMLWLSKCKTAAEINGRLKSGRSERRTDTHVTFRDTAVAPLPSLVN